MNRGKRFRCHAKALRAVGVLCVAASFVASARAQAKHVQPGREAAWLVGQLESTEWHSAYAAWKAKHTSISCRVFEGDGSALYIVDLWAYRCSTALGGGRANRFFYILHPTATPESELDQFQGEIRQSRAMPMSVMQNIHDRIESLLTARYGEPDAPQSVPAALSAWGSGDWRLLRIWRLPDCDICLYVRDTPNEPVAVGLLARDRALMVASTSQGTELLLYEKPDTAFEDQIDSRLASELKTDFPKVAALLSGWDTQPAPGQVLDTLAGVLERAINGTPDRHAELLLAADRIAAHLRLPHERELPPGLENRLNGLEASAHMHFSWDELRDAWIYHHDLLWSVWRGAPQIEWGQYAFFLLLDHGWDTSGICHAGADQFRTVIAQGDKFLEDYPDSPALRPVMFLLAQANETWWSLSHWSSCSPVTDGSPVPCAPAPQSARYQTGAAAARERAISEYKALLQADFGIYGTPEIRRNLARMELGIDTNQRRFYCLYN